MPAILPTIQLLPCHPVRFRHPAPAIQLLSSACPLSTPCPLLLHLCFSFSSRLVVLMARVEDGRLVGEGKLVREGRASASRRRGRRCQGELWVLATKADTGS